MNGRNKNIRKGLSFLGNTHTAFFRRVIPSGFRVLKTSIATGRRICCPGLYQSCNSIETTSRCGSYENRKLTTSSQFVHSDTRHESTTFQTEAFMNMFETDDASPFVGGSTQAPFLKRSLSAPAIAEHVSRMKVDQ